MVPQATLEPMRIVKWGELERVVAPWPVLAGTPEDRIALLESAGAVAVTLGPTVLRTETAGVVATALAIHARGGLGARRD
mgnify:CR=1 FL=1